MAGLLAHRIAGAPALWWIGFHVCGAALLLADLLTSDTPHGTTLRQALRWALAWVAFAAAMFALIWSGLGHALAAQFASGYLLEQTLSVDNLFLFIVIFRTFAIGGRQQHRVLTWGVLGAIAMRAVLLLGGIRLLARFQWLEYVFGAIILGSGVFFFFPKKNEDGLPKWLQTLLRRLPMAPPGDSAGHRFFVRRNGRLLVTALFLALLAIEATDLLFALDSIPAVLALSRDAFVVYTSNILAVLSLRSLFPAVVEAVRRFRYMHFGIALVLCFVGVKMLLNERWPIGAGWSLGTIAAILALTVAASSVPVFSGYPRRQDG